MMYSSCHEQDIVILLYDNNTKYSPIHNYDTTQNIQ